MNASSYLAPVTVAVLFVARFVELAMRRSERRGTVVARSTLPAMVWSGMAVTAVALVEFFQLHPPLNPMVYATGLLVVLAAFGIRAWAARALGNLWSTQIEIRQQHELVTAGPYHWTRHPIYVAAILELLGTIIILQAPFALIPFALFAVPVIVWRTVIEERAMRHEFGDTYRAYAQEVPAFFPAPWRRRRQR